MGRNSLLIFAEGRKIKQELETKVFSDIDFKQLLKKEDGAILHVCNIKNREEEEKNGAVFSKTTGMKEERFSKCAFLVREIIRYYKESNPDFNISFETIFPALPVATLLIDSFLFILVGLEKEKGLACLLAIAVEIDLMTKEDVQRLDDKLTQLDPLA
jgi:hypothetical protein